ncbi:carboxypeptidase Y-deficient [Apophysomyces sp. BC1034]|nr:carboxypeptidase Y-deficient [Apophysomyces sp. BC1015]KAG0184866.1 carboxypeptidase Y-deficient [Apophysomyces sp. BC1034]
MTTVRQLSPINYQDYVPDNGIVCPICDSPCMSLQILNQHLDTAHSEEDTKGAFISWFRNAGKKMQTTLASGNKPLSAGNNAVERSLRQLVDPALMSSFNNLNLGNNNPVFFVSDNDRQSEFVTKEHWCRESSNDSCGLPGCGKPLGNKQHCRQCGRLFCEAHTQYEIKLNREAQHDPENGVWCKVCVRCYMSREGYMNQQGVTRDLSSVFSQRRAKTIDRVYLESNRLEKRLEKLARIHHNADVGTSRSNGLNTPSTSISSLSIERSVSSSSKDRLSSNGGSIISKPPMVSSSNSILSMKLKYRDGEQTVAKWEDDRAVKKCPFCSNMFTLTNRKHHCRLCGRVVCGNTRCSKMIPLYLDMSSDSFDEEPVGDTRACRDCQCAVFRRKIRHDEATRPLPIFHLYHQLFLTRQNIEKLLPTFHDIILMLEQEKLVQQTHENYKMAAQVRKSLLDNFALYDTLSKSIRALPARTPAMKRLQNNICAAASIYLQRNMLPLQMLPRILKPEKTEKAKDSMQELRVTLQAYKEQYVLVEGYVREAKRNRKYDDVKTLELSLAELRKEIEVLQTQMTKKV